MSNELKLSPRIENGRIVSFEVVDSIDKVYLNYEFSDGKVNNDGENNNACTD